MRPWQGPKQLSAMQSFLFFEFFFLLVASLSPRHPATPQPLREFSVYPPARAFGGDYFADEKGVPLPHRTRPLAPDGTHANCSSGLLQLQLRSSTKP